MTILTLNIPDDVVAQATDLGIYDERFVLQAFKNLIAERATEQPRTLGGAESLLIFMADDFDEPLDDFRDYMP